MQEIKFRAWNVVLNQWDYFTFYNISHYLKEFEAHLLNGSLFYQYIGRKDNNNTEIYEGDTVKAQYWNEKNKLVWITGEINYDVECARYMIGNRTLASTIGASWEIIGHKFEQN